MILKILLICAENPLKVVQSKLGELTLYTTVSWTGVAHILTLIVIFDKIVSFLYILKILLLQNQVIAERRLHAKDEREWRAF